MVKTKFQDNLLVRSSTVKNPNILDPRDGKDKLSRNADKELPLLAA
jgi:hypothetical protein